MDSLEDTITIYIPIAMGPRPTDPPTAQDGASREGRSESAVIEFRPGVGSDTQTSLEWQEGVPIQTPGPCQMIVKEPIFFLMLQYDLTPALGQDKEADKRTSGTE